MIPVAYAAKRVRSAWTAERDLAARRTPKRRVGIGHHHAKLADRINADRRLRKATPCPPVRLSLTSIPSSSSVFWSLRAPETVPPLPKRARRRGRLEGKQLQGTTSSAWAGCGSSFGPARCPVARPSSAVPCRRPAVTSTVLGDVTHLECDIGREAPVHLHGDRIQHGELEPRGRTFSGRFQALRRRK